MKKIIKIVLILALLIILSASIWLNITYSPNTTARSFMGSSQKVIIQEEDYGISFTPSELKQKSGIIFYPGAKVESIAYSPLAFELAEKGYLVTIVEMPFNLAVLDVDKGKVIISKYKNIEKWYVGGHSLGGAMAGSFADDYSNLIEGVFFLGAYPVEDLSSSRLDVLLINGSLDSIINKERLEEAKKLIPKNSKNIIIEGANHSQFGAYGLQTNDNEAEISFEEQQKQTVEHIINLIKK